MGRSGPGLVGHEGATGGGRRVVAVCDNAAQDRDSRRKRHGTGRASSASRPDRKPCTRNDEHRTRQGTVSGAMGRTRRMHGSRRTTIWQARRRARHAWRLKPHLRRRRFVRRLRIRLRSWCVDRAPRAWLWGQVPNATLSRLSHRSHRSHRQPRPPGCSGSAVQRFLCLPRGPSLLRCRQCRNV